MAEGVGDLGSLTWSVGIRLSDLDNDIAQVDRRMEELYGRWERRSMTARLNASGEESGGGGTATRTLSGSGGDFGGGRQLFDVNSLDAVQRKVETITASVERATRDISQMQSLADRATATPQRTLNEYGERTGLGYTGLYDRGQSASRPPVESLVEGTLADVRRIGEEARTSQRPDDSRAFANRLDRDSADFRYQSEEDDARFAYRQRTIAAATGESIESGYGRLNERLGSHFAGISEGVDALDLQSESLDAARSEGQSWTQHQATLMRIGALGRNVQRAADDYEEGDTLTRDDLAEGETVDGGAAAGGGRRGNLLTRGFSRRFAGGLLAYEALRIGQGYLQEQETIGLNPGNLVAELGARQKFNESLESIPFAGQIAGIVGYGYQSLDGQTTQAAAFAAQQSLTDVAAGTQRLNQSRSYANQAQDNINAGILASDVGDLQRRRDAANQQYAATYRGIRDRDFALQQQYLDERQTDPLAAARTKAEHDLLAKNAGAILGSADYLRNSEVNAAYRDSENLDALSSIDVRTASRSYSLDVLNQPLARRRNEIQGSWERQILQLRQSNASETLISNAQSREDFELGSLNVDITRQRNRAIAGLDADTASIGLRLGRDPYGSQIEQVKRQAAADIDYLGNDPENDPQKRSIQRRADASVALIQQSRSDSLERLGIDQSAQLGQINALLARDPTLAEAIGIVHDTTTKATDIARQGPQFRQAAIDQLHLGSRRLDLERQEFLRGFRGTEFNPNRDDVTNPVDQVNIKKRLRDIDDAQKQIDEFAKNFDKSTGTGTAAPRTTGGHGDGKVTLDDSAVSKMTAAFSAALKEALAN